MHGLPGVLAQPSWFLVGAPKCGTTAIAAFLDEHPEVYVSPVKEPNWFNDDVALFRRVNSLDDYLRLFDGAPDGARCGEATTGYLFSKRAAANVHAAYPDARIVASFRDPVEMLPALHAQLLWEGVERERDFARAWAKDEPGRLPDGITYRGAVAYADQWQRYLDVFSKDACLAVTMDDLRRDVEGTYARICRHIGVDDAFRPEFRVVNERKSIRRWWVHRLLCRVPHTWAATRPGGWVYRAKHWNAGKAKPKPLDDRTVASIRSATSGQVERLAGMMGRQLWH